VLGLHKIKDYMKLITVVTKPGILMEFYFLPFTIAVTVMNKQGTNYRNINKCPM